MKLVTQDGRTLEISHEYHLAVFGSVHVSGKLEGKKAKLTATTFNKVIKQFKDGTTYETGDGVVERYGVIGEFSNTTGLYKARDALQEAWANGASEFVVPQDLFAKSADEQFDDFCEEHGLTCVTINELGYHRWDIPKNLKIWRETDEFERRGILVCDPETHDYDKSFAKWQALQLEATA